MLVDDVYRIMAKIENVSVEELEAALEKAEGKQET